MLLFNCVDHTMKGNFGNREKTVMRMRRILSRLAALALCAALIQAPLAKAAGSSQVTMRVGEERTIYAPITTAGTNNGYWTSNSPAVSIRNYAGYCCNVTAKSATDGMTAILSHHYTEKVGNYSVSRMQDVRVTVLAPLPTGVTLSPGSMTLSVGESRTLAASAVPDGADYGSYIYSNEDESVAMVDSGGRVREVSLGSTRIQVRTRNEARRAYCQVTVVPQVCRVSFNTNGDAVNPSAATVAVGETRDAAGSRARGIRL